MLTFTGDKKRDSSITSFFFFGYFIKRSWTIWEKEVSLKAFLFISFATIPSFHTLVTFYHLKLTQWLFIPNDQSPLMIIACWNLFQSNVDCNYKCDAEPKRVLYLNKINKNKHEYINKTCRAKLCTLNIIDAYSVKSSHLANLFGFCSMMYQLVTKLNYRLTHPYHSKDLI